MLQQLYIKNYALIREVNIQFPANLTIITGETGAGKSIILGALSLILGNKANKTALKNQEQKCIIEGTFDITAYQLDNFFEQVGLDYEPITIIRREISLSGKSRIFVNDTPTKVTTLKKLGTRLVSLHAQHQTLHLHDSQYHLLIVDVLAKHEQKLNNYTTGFKQYQKNIAHLKALVEQNRQAQRDLDYTLFQLNELTAANLNDPTEQKTLEQELNQLTNVETIKMSVSAGVQVIDEGDFSMLQSIRIAQNHIENITAFYPNFKEIANRLESIGIDLEDIRNELTHLENELLVEPERIEVIQERLNLIYMLQKKHLVDSIQELIAIRDELTTKSDSIENLSIEIEELTAVIEQEKEALWQLALVLSEERKQQFPILENHLNGLLAQVGMPHAKVKMLHEIATTKEQLTLNGIDSINLLFAANKGSQFESLKKVASGGELSRLMLCIQSLMAENMALPTLIFDEIDTGISGEVALKVGKVMQNLAKTHQIICITHLPQIASKGHNHLFVYKEVKEERTFTQAKRLTPQNRVVEIAKMLSGEHPTTMAMENAKDLLGVAAK